ncbi:MAG TPA: rod shape-determining protein MreD [Acidimicrobiales bacterium]|nr:rod shape-determining protein MreD [Acidimicrobiales bacterium]
MEPAVVTGLRFRLPPALLLVLVLQSVALQDLRVRDVHPDALLLFAVAAGIVAGAELGALVAFATGLVADLFVQTPMGLSALAFALVAFAVGTVQAGLIRAAWWITPLTAFVGSALGVVLFALIGAVLGQDHLVTDRLPLIALVVALTNAVLSLPAVRLASWALAEADR